MNGNILIKFLSFGEASLDWKRDRRKIRRKWNGIVQKDLQSKQMNDLFKNRWTVSGMVIKKIWHDE